MADEAERGEHVPGLSLQGALETHALVREGDLRIAGTLMRKVFAADHRTSVARGRQARFTLRAARVGKIGMARFGYGAPAVTRTTGPVDQINIGLIRNGSMEMARSGASCASGQAFVYSPGREMSLEMSPDLDFMALFVTPSAVREHLSQLTGRDVSGDVWFDPAPRSASSMLTLFSVLAKAVENTTHSQFLPPLVANNLAQLLLSTLLLEFPHTHSEQLTWQGVPGSPRVVRIVETALRERPEHPWTIGELAAAAGVSGRTVQVAFQRHVGMSAFDLLRQIRLERSHEDLREAREGDTVSSIAHRWGFGHPSRFAAAYRRRYQEAPSDTLRRSR
ncbi:AraC family transcriptional regulator [Streptomyces sp. NPDC091217]|uniref:AraC family transcriptional regulator n=1 Tax=Streptomyces sp. NPDC091217 TaxID=3365975 RepID=UPI0037F51026